MAAKPLSFMEYSQLKKSGFPTYKAYTSWWSKRVAPKFYGQQGAGQIPGIPNLNLPAGPSSAALTKQANRLFPAIPQSTLVGQARSTVQSSIDPIIAQIKSTIGAQTKAGQDAIAAYTDKFAQRVGNMDSQIEGMYSKAQAQQAGVTGVLADYLKGQGGDLAASLSNALPGTPTNLDLGAIGQGAAGAQGAYGTADLSNLIAQGTAETNYAKNLPTYARGLGQQELASFTGQQGRALSDQLGQVSSQVPGMVQDVYQSLLDREAAKQQNRASFLTSGLDRSSSIAQANADRAASLWTAQQGFALDQAKMGQADTQFYAGLAADAANAANTAAKGKTWSPQEIANAKATAVQNAIQELLTLDPTAAALGQTIVPAKYQNSAYQYMRPKVVAYLSGLLKGVPGLTHAEIVRLANNALGAKGIHPRGVKSKPTSTSSTASAKNRPGKGSSFDALGRVTGGRA